MSKRKYKTWEVIKELGENPTKKFQLNAPYGMIIGLKDGEVVDITSEGDIVSAQIFVNSDIKWTEIRQSVTWQEALEAWANGKTISCHDVYSTSNTYEGNSMEDENELPLEINEILYGVWYIED